MTLKEILNYSILHTETYSITVYKILIILVVLLATFIGLKLIRRIFKRFVIKQNAERNSFWSVYLIIRYLTWVIVIVLLLESAGVKISVLLASLAALLVGVGFGIQQLFNDIASGIVLLFERNLKIDDVIQLEDGTVGKVIDIGLRTSKLKTRDNIILVVPNSKFVNEKIINWSQMDFKTRFHVDVGIAYGSDTQLVSKVLLDCAKAIRKISNTPEPFIRFNNFGDSSLDFQIYFWVQDTFYVENIKSELRFAIDDAFRQNNIKIPFPQQDVHIK
ncbi:MAG: mechanosensitive ion channel [Prolixibacteraceae bacterium]|nr:mechanosensitive ion channel [Prolixibacteraceae bacterium]MBN2772774.1 mechanosensitive ion channel [Prolixibacteraceae bacterium]